MPAPNPRSFEQSLGELERRVVMLEKGDLDLDDALRLFEEGVGLVRECHERLDAAEARIVALTQTGENTPNGQPTISETPLAR